MTWKVQDPYLKRVVGTLEALSGVCVQGVGMTAASGIRDIETNALARKARTELQR